VAQGPSGAAASPPVPSPQRGLTAPRVEGVLQGGDGWFGRQLPKSRGSPTPACCWLSPGPRHPLCWPWQSCPQAFCCPRWGPWVAPPGLGQQARVSSRAQTPGTH